MSENKKVKQEKNNIENDLEVRSLKFIKEYGILREKYKVDIAAIPHFIPNEKGNFEIKIEMRPVDVSDQFIKSDFVQKGK